MLFRVDQVAGCPTDPRPADFGDQLDEHRWPGAPFGGEALAVRHAEIATGDGGPHRASLCLLAVDLRVWRAARDSNPNRQIRRLLVSVHDVRLSVVCAAQVRGRIQPDRRSRLW